MCTLREMFIFHLFFEMRKSHKGPNITFKLMYKYTSSAEPKEGEYYDEDVHN